MLLAETGRHTDASELLRDIDPGARRSHLEIVQRNHHRVAGHRGRHRLTRHVELRQVAHHGRDRHRRERRRLGEQPKPETERHPEPSA